MEASESAHAVVLRATRYRGYFSACSIWGPQTPGPSELHFPVTQIIRMYQQFSTSTPTDYGQTIINGPVAGPSTVAPHATTTTATTTTQPTAVSAVVTSGSNTGTKPQPLVATGDWANDLVQLAKTAELK